MTVCAAAICTHAPADGPVHVLAISDRMITSGDIEFESPQRKISNFPGTTIVALVAGDIQAHALVYREASKRLEASGDASVCSAANLYAACFIGHRRQIAEQRILAPLGLDLGSFISSQKEMDSILVADLASQLKDDQNVCLEAIVAGTDQTGAHIYKISNDGVAECCDSMAFVAIGSGARQFETQFMALKYGWSWDRAQTIMLMFAAKKSAPKCLRELALTPT
jgi:hypothetical protein